MRGVSSVWVAAEAQLSLQGGFYNGQVGVRRGLRKEKSALWGNEGGRETPLGTLGNWRIGVRNVWLPRAPLPSPAGILEPSRPELSSHLGPDTLNPSVINCSRNIAARVWALRQIAWV